MCHGSPYTISMETTLYLIYLQAVCAILLFSMMMEMEKRAWAARCW